MSSADKPIRRVLLTNDDGIDAPGLAVLTEIAAHLAEEVWTVAPAFDQSGTSHSISLHEPLRLTQHGERRFSVSGTPGDAVAMGLRHVLADAPPELILSGVNRGGNIGVETVFSGTVGAAMTAMLLGVPAIALSQTFRDRHNVPWDTARRLGPDVLRRLLALPAQTGVCLNVNFPAVPPDQAGPLTVTRQGPGLLNNVVVQRGTDPRGLDYFWLQLQRGQRENPADSETAAVARGAISVTPLGFERTVDSAYARLRESLSA